MAPNDWPDPNNDIDYDKGENRAKHNGVSKQPEIVEQRGLLVAKCPRGFNLDIARTLVRQAIPEYRKSQPDKPFRLWNYYDGAIYVAFRSDPDGRTWHGFPAPYPPPPGVVKALTKRAGEIGEELQLKKWLKRKW